jgi:hypothetical protein
MHIGRAGSQSKTECVFFPPPRFFNSNLPLSIANHDDNNNCNNALDYDTAEITEPDHNNEQKARQRRECEEYLYNNLEETQSIKIADGYVTFCKHFKYLGSYVSSNLTDDFDIDTRIAAASKSMGALKSVWDSPHLEIWSKYQLFRAIPMNLLLWGCETWSIRTALLNKLEVFLHCNIRRILRVSITRVKDERIKNEHVRRMFYDIPRTRNMIAARQMKFIGKVTRGPSNRPAQHMLTACCDNTRLTGRPFLHNKDHIVRNLRLLFADVPEVQIDDYGSLHSWIREAQHEKILGTTHPMPCRPSCHPSNASNRMARTKAKPKKSQRSPPLPTCIPPHSAATAAHATNQFTFIALTK